MFFEKSSRALASIVDASNRITLEEFNPERLFASIAGNVTDVLFFNPYNQTTAATKNRFGIIFSDADFTNATRIELYDANDPPLGR